MNAIREPAVAGMFYPNDPAELGATVDQMLATSNATPSVAKALIAPHAGHVYSGPVAAAAYAPLAERADDVKRVVLLGPSHRVGFRGIAASTANTWRTPLGDIPVDTAAIAGILDLPEVGFLDQAHAQEHSLEVHLPFLQRALNEFTLVPLVVGDASPQTVASVLERLWGGPETLVVISSDLSHFHEYEEARRLDTRTAERIVALDETLNGEDACGCRPINGLIHFAKQRGLEIRQLAMKNSGDTQGDRQRVVGYGAFMIAAPDTSSLSLAHRQRLIQVAREAILQPLNGQPESSIDPEQFPASFQEKRASFVTINLRGHLQGCIGSLAATRPLVLDVASNARSAAFRDPRFQPLTLAEYQDIDVHISILSKPEPMALSSSEELISTLRPGVDGLIIEERGRRATYLPSVWEQLPDPATFVRELRRKAGLTAEGWSSETRVWRYQTEEFA